MDLLEKIRIINKELQKNSDIQDNLKKLPELLYNLMDANIYIISHHGNLLGAASNQRIEQDLVRTTLNKQKPSEMHGNNLEMQHKAGVYGDSNKEYLTVPAEYKNLFKDEIAAVVPIISGRESYGSIYINRLHKPVCEEDLILAEYVATYIGLMLHRSQEKRREVEARRQTKAQRAIQSLTHSELGAAELIFQELGGKDGLLVASEAAKKFGISRSILIVALRKLKSAGIIESHSLGVKGTYIKILNEKILDEFTITPPNLSDECS